MSVIEDAEGKTYDEEEQIAGQISSYFSSIFTTDSSVESPTRTREIVSSVIAPSLSDETNNRLCSIHEPA